MFNYNNLKPVLKCKSIQSIVAFRDYSTISHLGDFFICHLGDATISLWGDFFICHLGYLTINHLGVD